MALGVRRTGLVAWVALALTLQAGSGLATAHSTHRMHRVVKHGLRVGVRAPAGRRLVRATHGTPSFVYGESAPYYVYGPGGGDAFGNDPIGGPEHVGDGGPGVNLGGGYRSGIHDEVIDGAGVIGGFGR